MEDFERRKVAELLKEMRSKNDGESVGATDDGGRLNWMYKAASELINREDYLLGKSIDKSFEALNNGDNTDTCLGRTGEQFNVPKRLLEKSDNTEQVDIAKKILEDPLYAIKQKELEARKKLLNNPVKLKQIKQMLMERSKKQATKLKSKKAKKKKLKLEELDRKILTLLKKFSEKEKKNALSKVTQTDSDYVSTDDTTAKKKKKHSKKTKRKSSSSSSSSTTSEESESESEPHSKKRTEGKRKEKKKTRTKHKKKIKSRKDITSDSSDSSDEGKEKPNEQRKKSEFKKFKKSTNLKSSKKVSTSKSYSSTSTSSSSTSNSSSDSSDDSAEKEVNNKNKEKSKNKQMDSSKNKCRKRISPERNSGEKERKKDYKRFKCSDSSHEKSIKNYGLMMPDGSKPVPEQKAVVKRYDKPAETKAKYILPSKSKPLSKREQEKKLKEMMKDAKDRKKDRERNLANHRKVQAEEEKLDTYDEDFMRRQMSHLTSQGTMADRIKSNVNNIQRSKSSMDSSFMRK